MQEQKNITQADDEIDLIALAKTIWEGRRTVVKTTLIFLAIGLFVALFSKTMYTSSTVIIPQSSGDGVKVGGNLGGLAAMAGINLNGIGSAEIPPSLYPKIFNSLKYKVAILNSRVSYDETDTLTLREYLKEEYDPGVLYYVNKYSVGLPKTILKAIRKRDNAKEQYGKFLRISSDEKELYEFLDENLSIEYDEKDGCVSIKASMPYALASAQITNSAKNILQNIITELKIEKATGQLAFIKERYNEKRKEFLHIQKKLAVFKDKNQNVSTSEGQMELERLQSDYNLVYGLYSELAKQLESQKIKVEEDTPVFTIIKPAVIPFEKSRPRRLLILIIWGVIGGIVGVSLVLGKEFMIGLKAKWNIDKSKEPIVS